MEQFMDFLIATEEVGVSLADFPGMTKLIDYISL